MLAAETSGGTVPGKSSPTKRNFAVLRTLSVLKEAVELSDDAVSTKCIWERQEQIKTKFTKKLKAS
jgi:hypothetical protein